MFLLENMRLNTSTYLLTEELLIQHVQEDAATQKLKAHSAFQCVIRHTDPYTTRHEVTRQYVCISWSALCVSSLLFCESGISSRIVFICTSRHPESDNISVQCEGGLVTLSTHKLDIKLRHRVKQKLPTRYISRNCDVTNFNANTKMLDCTGISGNGWDVSWHYINWTFLLSSF